METFPNYTSMRHKIGELYHQGDFQQAVNILNWGLKAFPDHLAANTFNLALCQVQLSRPDQAVRTLQHGLQHGVWFGPFEIGIDAWEPIREKDSFKKLLLVYDECRRSAQRKARPLLDIALPSGYEPRRAYPLFIALHGSGETIEGFKRQWTSPRLSREFITAYPQSSRVVSMDGFSWVGDWRDRREMSAVYKRVLAEHKVDSDRIILGGFSAGGYLALTLILGEVETVPVRGFIVLCPPVPREVPFRAVKRIVENDQRGVLLTTEMDDLIVEQERFVMVFEAGGIPIKFEIFPNFGRWYPPDLGVRMDGAIDFILER
jgi:predicted esterase